MTDYINDASVHRSVAQDKNTKSDTATDLGTSRIRGFAWRVDSAIRSFKESLRIYRVHSFASRVNSAMRSSNAATEDFDMSSFVSRVDSPMRSSTATAEDFLVHSFASLVDSPIRSSTSTREYLGASPLRSFTVGDAMRFQSFALAELIAATNHFSFYNHIGDGYFGFVFKGKLADGREVAIKRFANDWKMESRAFESLLTLYSRLHHKHLVMLVGFCEEKDERLLVYEYMENGSLYDILHGKNNVEKCSTVLNSWKMRIQIALDACRGMEYLHDYAVPPVIHGDIKPFNILVDANWTARVSSCELSITNPGKIGRGTFGYIDPECFGPNESTAKSDVYGVGVVLLELLTGKRAIFSHGEDGGIPLSVVDFAVPVILAGELMKILDPRVGPREVNEAEAVELVAYTAIHCVNLEGKDRPTMADIVVNLERALAICDSRHESIFSSTISHVSE